MTGAAHAQTGHALNMPTPRLLSSALAAEYVGLSDSGFAARVKDGVMPAPIKIGKRRLWDVRVLDKAIDRMSGLGASSTEDAIRDSINEALAREVP